VKFPQLLIRQGVISGVETSRTMNRKPMESDASLESDAVWKLLDLATPAAAGPRFVDDTVRVARLAGQAAPWWRVIFRPAPLAGLAAAAAVVVVSVIGLLSDPRGSGADPSFADSAQAAEIQDIAETEALIAAVDHLDDFSDTELVSLIGF
jgi:hypothetical protein